MKVLKFGGTSVADTKSLSHVIAILKNTSDRQFVVVSALGGITNLLIQMAEKASEGNTEFQNELSTIEQRHLSIIQEFLPLTHQSEIISFLKTELNKLEALLDSIKILRELTPKSLAKVSSFGELLSSKIIFSVLQHQHLDIELKDARTLIFTHQVNDREIVNHQKK